MVDNLSLAISHGLLLLCAWRLLSRVDLDDEQTDTVEKPSWGRRPKVKRDA